MAFAAKFGGTCSKCAGRIPAGDMVNYDGRQIRHAPRCPAKGSITEVPAPAVRQDESLSAHSKILGRAAYKSKSGYLVLWHGVTKEGKRATKLAFRDGSKMFWGNGDVQIEKMYDEPITFGRLNELAAEFKAEKTAEATALAEQRKRSAARDAKAKESGKTLAEVIADEQAEAAEARKGLREFIREGKDTATVGETTQTRKDGTVKHYEIVAVGKPYYHSQDACDDMDCFCGRVGWKTPYTSREIAATPEQLAAELKASAETEERKILEAILRRSYSADTHLGSSGPDGITLTDAWHDRRQAGSETWYVGSDGIVYHMRSDYDMGPSWWRTTAAPEQVRRAAELGMKP